MLERVAGGDEVEGPRLEMIEDVGHVVLNELRMFARDVEVVVGDVAAGGGQHPAHVFGAADIDAASGDDAVDDPLTGLFLLRRPVVFASRRVLGKLGQERLEVLHHASHGAARREVRGPKTRTPARRPRSRPSEVPVCEVGVPPATLGAERHSARDSGWEFRARDAMLRGDSEGADMIPSSLNVTKIDPFNAEEPLLKLYEDAIQKAQEGRRTTSSSACASSSWPRRP